jgi:lactate dehydrogenase-like 2-hydroxyacid dehydrogenase
MRVQSWNHHAMGSLVANLSSTALYVSIKAAKEMSQLYFQHRPTPHVAEWREHVWEQMIALLLSNTNPFFSDSNTFPS